MDFHVIGSSIRHGTKRVQTPSVQNTSAEIHCTLQQGLKAAGIKEVVKEIFPAGTDSRYWRFKGYRAYGFSPMNNTPILLHDHNEFIRKDIFLNGIDIYKDIIRELANKA